MHLLQFAYKPLTPGLTTSTVSLLKIKSNNSGWNITLICYFSYLLFVPNLDGHLAINKLDLFVVRCILSPVNQPDSEVPIDR